MEWKLKMLNRCIPRGVQYSIFFCIKRTASEIIIYYSQKFKMLMLTRIFMEFCYDGGGDEC